MKRLARPAALHAPGRAPADQAVSRKELLRDLGFLSLVALQVATLLVPSEAVFFRGTQLALNFLWLLLLFGWSLAVASRRLTKVHWHWCDLPVTFLFGWHSLSALVMAGHGNARYSLNMLWQWLAFAAAYWLSRQLIRTARDRRAVCAAMLSVTVGLAAWGLWQRTSRAPIADVALRQVTPASPWRAAFDNRSHSVEPTATFLLTNSLAGVLSSWGVLLLALLVVNGGWGHKNAGSRGILAATAVLVLACLVLTKSRSAYIATFTGCGLLATATVRRWTSIDWRWPVGAGAILATMAGLSFAMGDIDGPLWTEAGKSLGFRAEYWRASCSLIADAPWFGCGPGNFQDAYARYKLPQSSELVADPHNFLVEIWATAGTPAALATLAGIGMWMVHWRPPSASLDSESPETRDTGVLAVGILAGVVVGLVSGVVVLQMTPLLSLAVGMPPAVVCFRALRPWVRAGGLPAWLPAVSLIVMLVHLLASGGIGFPGVAQTLWLLAAMILNARTSSDGIRLPRHVAVGVVLAASSLLWANYATMLRPMTKGRALQDKADLATEAGDWDQARQYYLSAVDVDPWSPAPWSKLADMHYRAWVVTSQPDDRAQFEDAASRALALDPLAAHLRRHLADLYLRAFGHRGDRAALGRAIELYTAANDLYPNHAAGWAQLAWAQHLNGDFVSARNHAAEALRLDARMPHTEQKLAAQSLVEGPMPPDVTAEQVMRRVCAPGNSE